MQYSCLLPYNTILGPFWLDTLTRRTGGALATKRITGIPPEITELEAEVSPVAASPNHSAEVSATEDESKV